MLIGVLDGPNLVPRIPHFVRASSVIVSTDICVSEGGGGAKTMRNVWLMLKISFCVGVYNLDNDGPEVTPGQVHSNWLVSTLGLCNNWLV